MSQGFVDRLVEGVSSFLLGGRAWLVVQLRHDERIVKVNPGPRGRQPSWGGFLPQFLGLELCQKILGVLRSEEVFAYLHADAAAVLIQQRAGFEGVLSGGVERVEIVDDELRWWTFAGGRINATLRHALSAVGGDWKIVPDNFMVKVTGAHLDMDAFQEALTKLRAPGFWEDTALWGDIAASLPDYRLSKFQPLMPDWVEREVVTRFLLDVPGARDWVRGGG